MQKNVILFSSLFVAFLLLILAATPTQEAKLMINRFEPVHLMKELPNSQFFTGSSRAELPFSDDENNAVEVFQQTENRVLYPLKTPNDWHNFWSTFQQQE